MEKYYGKKAKVNKMEAKNIYQKLGCQQVINACGYMTKLGTSTVKPLVLQQMNEASQNFVVIEELYQIINKKITSLLKVEAAQPVNSAASGIALSCAAIIYKTNFLDVYQSVEQNEIIIPKGHNINFGAPIEMMMKVGGAKVVEAGWSNGCTKDDIISKITNKKARLLYVVSHHCVQKNMISLSEYLAVARLYHLPVIVDCAAEDNLQKYCDLDLWILSGAKALNGPTSGLVLGKKEYIYNLKHHFKGIGRTMKIGKENIIGLLCALENYLNNSQHQNNTFSALETLITKINNNKYFVASLGQDTVRKINRCRISLLNENIELLKKLIRC